MNKRIRLLKEWENDGTKFAPGIYEVDEDTAKELIEKGLAEEVKEGDASTEGEAKAVTAEDVQAIVKTVLKANEPEPVRRLPKIAVGKELLEDDPNVGYRPFKELGLGQFLCDVRTATKAIQSGQLSAVPERLTKSQAIMTKAPAGMNQMVGDEGDFLVVTEHRNELLRKAHELGVVFTRARPVPMTAHSMEIPMIVETSRVDGSRQGGVRGFWTNEGGTTTASKPSFGKVMLTANKLRCYGHSTDELEEDASIGALQLLGELFAEEIAFKLDDAFIRGSGGGQPQGILNANALVAVTRDTPSGGNVVTEDIVAMYSRMFARSRANAVWFYNQDVEPDLFTMTLTGGTSSTPVYMPPGGLSESPFARIMGRPAIPIEFCVTKGTVGDILFVDMTQYLYGQRRGIESAQSIHVNFATDQIAFRASLRGDGQPWWGSALTPFQGTNTQSPFIALAT